MKFRKEHRPYGVMIVTAEVDGKTVTKELKAGATDAEIAKAFASTSETKKSTKK